MYKPLISTLLLFSVTLSGLLFGTGIALATSDSQSSTQSSVTDISQFHIHANQITNRQLSLLLNFFDDFDLQTPNFTDQILIAFSPPSFLDENGTALPAEIACQDNLSATCLHRLLMIELLILYDKLSFDANRLPTDGLSFNSLLETVQTTNSASGFITEQYLLAVEITKQVVNFYSQILQTFPIHVQNQITINELEKLKANLFDLRVAMQPYTTIFHNVTSAACE